MTILQNGPDIQCFSRTALGLRTQFFLLDFQVDQCFNLSSGEQFPFSGNTDTTRIVLPWETWIRSVLICWLLFGLSMVEPSLLDNFANHTIYPV